MSVQTKIRRLEATLMTLIKHGSAAWALQNADENLLDVLKRNCLWIVLGIWLTDCISDIRLYEDWFNPTFHGYNERKAENVGHIGG